MKPVVFAACLAGIIAAGCDRASTTATGETGASDQAVARSADRAVDGEPTPLEKAVRRSEIREFTIPAGTELPLILETAVGSDTSKVEQPVRARLSRTISVNGQPVLAEGSSVSGFVTDATRSGKVKGVAHVAVRFDTVVPAGADERYSIHTSTASRTAASTKEKDALKIGAPAAGGAVIGAIVGGGKGAAIGAAAGGGAGTAVVLSTRGKEVHLPLGSALRVRLTEPLTITIVD
jgi:hypothetical protein